MKKSYWITIIVIVVLILTYWGYTSYKKSHPTLNPATGLPADGQACTNAAGVSSTYLGGVCK